MTYDERTLRREVNLFARGVSMWRVGTCPNCGKLWERYGQKHAALAKYCGYACRIKAAQKRRYRRYKGKK